MKKTLLFLALFAGIFAVFSMTGAFAASDETGLITDATGSGGDMQKVLCNVLVFVTGTVGKTLASFIIIGVGLGFFTGKVSWGLLIGVTLGISAMFGAPAIIGALTGEFTITTTCTKYGKKV